MTSSAISLYNKYHSVDEKSTIAKLKQYLTMVDSKKKGRLTKTLLTNQF